MSNLLEYENRYYDLGYDYIIGLDEAGRGPMAGELVVAGVIFPKGFYDERIFDSKQLTAKKLHVFFPSKIPCNDGSIAIGQIAIAAALKKNK